MKKKSVITARITSEIKDYLYEQSQINNVSINTLVGQIVSKHAKWDGLIEDIGFFILPKKLLKRIFTTLTKKQSIEVGQTIGREILMELTIFLYSEFNKETLTKTIVEWCEYTKIGVRHMDSNPEKVIIQHEFGSNWNHFFLAMVESLFEDTQCSLKNIIRENDLISFDIVPIESSK